MIDRDDIREVQVYRVNGRLVVANSFEGAVNTYRAWATATPHADIDRTERVRGDGRGSDCAIMHDSINGSDTILDEKNRTIDHLAEENARLKAELDKAEHDHKEHIDFLHKNLSELNDSKEEAIHKWQQDYHELEQNLRRQEQRCKELEAQADAPIDGLSGVGLIITERCRQIEQEGFDAAHDRQHDPNVLISAAVAYALYCLPDKQGVARKRYWPFGSKWWKPDEHDAQRNLVKAGALIAAAIDRLKEYNTPEEL